MKAAVMLIVSSLFVGTARAMPADTSLLARWTATSRVTPSEAARTLAAEDDRHVHPVALFEARKHLRSDGRLSMAEHVLRESFRARLGMLLGSEPPAASMRPPMLHWLEWRATREGLELRGESAQVARVSGDRGRSFLVFDHRSIHELWTERGGELRVRRLPSPPCDGEDAYRLVLPREHGALSCDPVSLADPGAQGGADLFVWEPSAWERDVALRRVVCELRGESASVTSRWELLRDGRLARPPATAPSSVANNPLDIDPQDESAVAGFASTVAPRRRLP